jgi:hypothetical protein
MSTKLEADYLVVGAGAMGMAFVDTLIAETDATVVMVDRHHQPGGHWNMAYPFVRLHQPSAGYGVNSRVLGSDAIDLSGWNKGLYELATCGEVCGYFNQVMQQTLLPSGRVRYFPMAEYDGDGAFHSLVTGEALQVAVNRRTVDSTHQRVTVPSMRRPEFEVAEGVACVPPNALTALSGRHSHYTVVGAGKTGMDACLWLLAQGVDPDALTWIMPRDSWVHDRAMAQPGPLFAAAIADVFARQSQAIIDATSLDDLFERLEACGYILRFDPAVRPTMYRCATVSQAEFAALKSIRDVVRLGRVKRIDADAIHLANGVAAAGNDTLYVDCTADGLARRPTAPVFDGAHITLQSVRPCQQVFSAAFIAHVEAAYTDDTIKNDLCVPTPHPDRDVDLLENMIAHGRNAVRWNEDPALEAWLNGSRLDWLGKLSGLRLPAEPAARAEALKQRRQGVAFVAAKLQALIAGQT